MANTKEPLASPFPICIPSLLPKSIHYLFLFLALVWSLLVGVIVDTKCCMVALSSCSLLPSLTPALGETGRDKVRRALEGHIRHSVMAEGSGFDINITHPQVALSGLALAQRFFNRASTTTGGSPLWIFFKEAEPKGGHFISNFFQPAKH